MQTYMRLYQGLCEQIISGKWKQGERFPTEADICNSFGVSRITTRQAFKLLEEQGLIERFAGRGTFIKATRPQKSAILHTDFTGSVRSGSYNIDRKLILQKEIPVPAKMAGVLELLNGATVLYAERLDMQGSEPMAYDRVYIPLELTKNIDSETLAKVDFLERWLAAEKLKIEYSKESIEAIAADAYTSKLLKVKRNTPMLLAIDLLYIKGSKPAALFESIYRGDKIKLISTVKKDND